MAAFCTCCGAEITLKAEACPLCGTPRHGSLPSDKSLIPGAPTDLSRKDVSIGSRVRRLPSRRQE
jgi:predicted amidophosphoribosyltransferase